MGGHTARMREMKNAYNILVAKSKGKRPLGRPMLRWENKIRIDLRKTGWECVDWIHLVQLAGCCEHGNEPSGYVKGSKFLDWRK
jgi:hypothetical protein